MKKYLVVLPFLIMALFMTSCDKEAELKDTAYITLSFSFTNASQQLYKIHFDGKEITDGHALLKKNHQGLLEVFAKGNDNPQLQTEITAGKDSVIRLIEIADDKFDIYDSKKYVRYKPNVIYMDGVAEQYEAKFAGIPITYIGENYYNVEQSRGSLEIFKKGEKTPVYTSEEISLSPNYPLTVLQLSETEFLFSPTDNEPNPSSKQYSKVRIFYTSSALPNVEAIKVIIYAFPGISMSEFKPIATIENLKVGEFSDYFTIDWNYYAPAEPVGFCYDIINIILR